MGDRSAHDERGGWRRPGGTNRIYLSFVSSFLFLCLADMGGRSMGCLSMTA